MFTMWVYDMNVGTLYLKSALSPYFEVWISKESNPLTIFEMPWIGQLIGPLAYILKFIFVEICSHIICVQTTFDLCKIILIVSPCVT